MHYIVHVTYSKNHAKAIIMPMMSGGQANLWAKNQKISLPLLPIMGRREKIFRFKQFAVVNDRTAMKVGTDGVLLGAWCPVEGARRVLDVGTGCGVIALMVAQRNRQALIEGIDIDKESITEACLNFASSPWSNRLTATEGDFNDMDRNARYDLIISNPPYFTNGILPTGDSRTVARHTASLTYRQLIDGASRLLSDDGILALISPGEAYSDSIEACTFASLPVRRLTHVIPVEGALPKRLLWQLSRRDMPYSEDSLTIAHTDVTYTSEYVALTGAFYLKM